jgi:hypothetical protein
LLGVGFIVGGRFLLALMVFSDSRVSLRFFFVVEIAPFSLCYSNLNFYRSELLAAYSLIKLLELILSFLDPLGGVYYNPNCASTCKF